MATTKQNQIIAGRMVEFQDQFSPLSKNDAQWVIQNAGEAIKLFVNAIVNRAKSESTTPKPLLSLISGGSTLTLKALRGKRLIYKAKNTFKSFPVADFVNWGINKPDIATPETTINVHEMVANGTFLDIFRSLPGTWNQKWLSQDQVIEFCESLPDWLRQSGNATFFLIKKDENKPIDENNPEDNLVVVLVHVCSDGLVVSVSRLERAYVWDGGGRRRVVSPQLMPSGN